MCWRGLLVLRIANVSMAQRALVLHMLEHADQLLGEAASRSGAPPASEKP